jgi:hypothetical protein
MCNFLAGKIWFYKVEGLPPLNGLNVYKLSDPNSAGFLLKIGLAEFRVRYSKRVRKWFVGFEWHRRIETEIN